jgi:ribosome-binding protein aMBF1 (putative translation factor)
MLCVDSSSAIITAMHGGILIRLARRRAGLSQRELARRLNTKQSVVARWESLATSPTVESVSAAGRACGFAVDWRLVQIDLGLERVLREQLRRSPADRIASVVNLAALRRA